MHEPERQHRSTLNEGLPLAAFRGAGASADLAAFMAGHHATAYLLHHGPLDAKKRSKAWQETASVSVLQTQDDVPTQCDFLVFPIHPREGSHFTDSVSVGRASNNDIVIEHESVSKCHAHLRLDGGRVRLFDDGSSVGTYLGSRRLVAREPLELISGSGVRFGAVNLVFMFAPDFYALLKGLFR